MKTRKRGASSLGSARASRAADGALAIANSSKVNSSACLPHSEDCGEAPQSAREARALPRIATPPGIKLGLVLAALILFGCETANYVPPVTPKMTATSHGKRATDLSTLERGRKLFAHRCIECHTLPPIWKYSNEDWPKIVDDMSHRASLKPEDRAAVVAYILAARASER